MSAPTLYDRLGGAAVLDSLIPAFYTRVMADGELWPGVRGLEVRCRPAAVRCAVAAAP